jgi:uncharacterized membrane protein YfhO
MLGDTQVVQSIYEKQRGGLEITHFHNDVITGRITSKTGGVLFLSIPFDPGWHIHIDGKEVAKMKVNIGFLGAFVMPGAHTVRLEYIPPYYITGRTLTICAWVFFALALGLFGKKSKRWLAVDESLPARDV